MAAAAAAAAMSPAAMAGIMAALGLGKSMLIDAPQQRKQMMLAAKTAELSPWTKLTPNIPAPIDFLGPALQGGIAGYSLGQAQQQFDMDKQLHDFRMDYLKNKYGNPGMPSTPLDPAMAPSTPSKYGDFTSYGQSLARYPSNAPIPSPWNARFIA